MNKNTWIIFFFLVLLADLVAIYIGNDTIRYFSKPLITITLIGYFVTALAGIDSPLKKWIVSALLFCCIGDILLLLEVNNSRFFILGLSAFLLAHLIYIFYFHHVRILESLRGKAWLLLPVAVYYAAIITWISPYLGEFKIPVRIYAVVISFMFMLALHMFFIRNKRAGWFMAGGAFLFLVSDSILAINKFYDSFEFAGIAIMITYGLAQYFIVKGATEYIKNDL